LRLAIPALAGPEQLGDATHRDRSWRGAAHLVIAGVQESAPPGIARRAGVAAQALCARLASIPGFNASLSISPGPARPRMRPRGRAALRPSGSAPALISADSPADGPAVDDVPPTAVGTRG
jgi:hypothetical protein